MTNNNTGYGLGADGYIAIHNFVPNDLKTIKNTEPYFRTMPVSFESFIKYYRENIENKNLLGQRHKRKNDLGYEIVEGQIIIDCYPTLVGYFLFLLLGDLENTKIKDGEGVYQKDSTKDIYTHTWQQNLDSDRALQKFTVHQAFGSGDPEEFTDCVLDGMTIECEKGSNIKMSFPLSHGKLSNKSDITRKTCFQYPPESAYNWSNIKVNKINEITENNVKKIEKEELKVHSFSLNIDLNYRKNEFFLGSSQENDALFNGIPIVTLNLNVDADKKYLNWARKNIYCNFEIDITSNLLIDQGQDDTHSFKINLPSCQLNPQTALEHSEERITMDLEFDCAFSNCTDSKDCENSEESINSIFRFQVKDSNQHQR